MKGCIKLIFLVTFVNAVIATDYCSKDICKEGDTHVACNNEGKFSPNCPSDAELREITEPLKNLIVQTHNEKRNTIAAGGGDLKPVCRMATMEWDEELASLAKLNVLKCEMEHDKCHNTDAFKHSGQNLADIGFLETANDTDSILQSIDLWFNEKKNVKQNIIDKFPRDYAGPMIGHFTALASDRNIRVGCAASTYTVAGKDFKDYLFACNYAATNMVDFPIYKSCDKPAAECQSGTNPSYENLCSTSESYDVNKYY
ncbi:antigen 5 like allergen Cul n 1-like [Lucilia sericata]|uniref:antigen 5 like allergen Cul n 1-like n=1 Tax=Lucilia sericata TaxID=13632 RepID=UPI0018A869C6|nr:antigen 5 like allergen Cul n 1-like [Lucilia sericata]